MKVFLAFPFSNIINEKDSMVENKYKNFLETCREMIIKKKLDLFLAHYREKWGKKLMTAEECTPLDLEEMKESDLVFAFPGAPISGGVHIELGWASALGKKIVLFLNTDETYSPLIMGLNQIAETKIVYYKDIQDDIIMETIDCITNDFVLH